MIELPRITLVCIDCVAPSRAFVALKTSMKDIKFGSVKLLSSKDIDIESDIRLVKIRPIDSKEAYSRFILKELDSFYDTDFVLVIQWDGYVWNSKAWTDEFFEYDFIGAPWHWDKVVGNGGFSLRSRKLTEMTRKHIFDAEFEHPEDMAVCRIYRKNFEEQGIKFAPVEVAYKFSVEHEPYVGSFGFHGGSIPRL